MENSSDALLKKIRERISEQNSRTLQVTHLPRQTKLKDLLKYFKTAVNARFPKKHITGNRRYVFLEFSSEDGIKEALEKAKTIKFKGKLPKCELVSHKLESGKVKNPKDYKLKEFQRLSLNISCLPRETVESEVRNLFPKLKSLNFPHEGPNKALGSAKVVFSSQEDALEAFESQHGIILHGSPVIVNFCLKKKSGLSDSAKKAKAENKNARVSEFKVVKDKIKAKRTFKKIKKAELKKKKKRTK